MPSEIYLVKAGMTMTEGMVAQWYVPDGSQIKKGELVYEMETEKITLEVEAEADGVVRHAISEGVMLPPGAVVGFIYGENEQIPDVIPSPEGAPAESEQAAPTSPPLQQQQQSSTPAASANRGEGGRILSSPAARRLAGELNVDIAAITGTGPGGRIIEADVQAAADAKPAAPAASPLAKRLAKELGVDLTQVAGSGPGGRITKDDVEAAAKAPTPTAKPASAPVAGPAAGEVIAVRGMRKTIAQRMHESLQNSAQLTMDMDVSMEDAVKLRGQLVKEWESEGVKPTYTDLVIRAVAKALRMHPVMNSEFRGDSIALLDEVHVGMAVGLEEGLIVPVVRNADQLSVRDVALESTRLASAARDGKLGLDELHGGTFTVSALGMFGVDSFTPIINAPQSGILGVNRIRDGLVWDGDRPLKKPMMNLSLTWDHRVLDGAPAAQFLASVKELLEAPYRLLV
ncbi:MAG: 2-oxo acid dehydrogenase subunit E2 [Pseudomonadota bacterium]